MKQEVSKNKNAERQKLSSGNVPIYTIIQLLICYNSIKLKSGKLKSTLNNKREMMPRYS